VQGGAPARCLPSLSPPRHREEASGCPASPVCGVDHSCVYLENSSAHPLGRGPGTAGQTPSQDSSSVSVCPPAHPQSLQPSREQQHRRLFSLLAQPGYQGGPSLVSASSRGLICERGKVTRASDPVLGHAMRSGSLRAPAGGSVQGAPQTSVHAPVIEACAYGAGPSQQVLGRAPARGGLNAYTPIPFYRLGS